MEQAKEPILQQAETFAQMLPKHSVLSAVQTILYDLRIPVKYQGFRYLKCVLLIAMENPVQIELSEIYAKAGRQFSPVVKYNNMDNAIRDALQKPWLSRSNETRGKYIPQYMLEEEKQPSNLDFISVIVYFLEMWQDLYEKEASCEKV